MKQALIYVLAVWLTTVLGGPFIYMILYYLCKFIYATNKGFGNLQWISGLLSSLPGLVVCLVIVPLINLLPLNLNVKKVMISIVGGICVILPLYLLKERFVNWVIGWTVSYCSIMIGAVWLYKLNDK